MASSQPKRAVIIGGGISGLTTGYELSRRGYAVTLLERRPLLGGLARAQAVQGRSLEVYYHFICGGDRHLISLLEELGLDSHLHWQPAHTSYFVEGRLYPFTTPLDILRFSPIPVGDRLRFGLHAARCRRMTNWKRLEYLTAEAWLRQEVGDRAYEVIWQPLLEMKFGRWADQVSAPWIWHRLHRASRSRRSLLRPEEFGYLEQGSEMLLQALVQQIGEAGGDIHRETEATALVVRGDRAVAVETEAGEIPADLVIAAVPLPELIRLLPEELSAWRSELSQIDFLGVTCLRLVLDRNLTDSFWVNVNDPRVNFNGFIEYSNLNRQASALGGVVYLPLYLSTDAARYSCSAERLVDELFAGLQIIVPDLERSGVRETLVTRDEHAQAVCPPGFSRRMPGLGGPVRGLYLLDSTQLYPSDRCLSGMIGLARELVQLIEAESRS